MPVSSPLRTLCCVLCVLQAVASAGVDVLTATVNTNIKEPSSSVWDIPEALMREKDDTKEKWACEVVAVVVLQVGLDDEQHWGSGRGSLKSKHGEMECVYMSVTGAEVWHQTDIPNTLNVAVSCACRRDDVSGSSICTFLSEKETTGDSSPLTITLQPSPAIKGSDSTIHQLYALRHTTARINRWDPPNLHFKLTNQTSIPAVVSVQLSPYIIPAPHQHSQVSDVRKADRPDAVCITQTFRNDQTGPMLYMFVRHYLSLGWEVLIYDRFGYHKEFMVDFVKESGVHYHAYTAYELLYPGTYNVKFAEKQSQKYQFYSERGWRGFGKSVQSKMLNNNEESDHDSDRRKTFMMARQQYSYRYYAILFPDRDEFLLCDVLQHQMKENNLTSQTFMQHRHFRMLQRRTGAQSIDINRIAHSSRYPVPDDVSSSSLASISAADLASMHRRGNTQVDIQEHTSRCLNDGFKKRDMVRLWSCFSPASVANTKSKSGEVLLGETCPFVGVHETCLRCKCKKVQSKKCHYLHLNTNYFKPMKLYTKYGNSIYDPLSAMVNMWN